MPGGWALRGLVLTGLAAVALDGAASTVLALVATLGLLLPAPRVPAGAWPWLHGLVLCLTGLMAISGASIPAFALLTAWLLVYQQWSGRSADGLRTSILLATLLLLLGCIQSESPLLAPVFGVYTVLLPITLLRACLDDVDVPASRSLELGMSAVTLLVAGTLFVAIPRLDGGYLGGREGRGGFPDGVTLGTEGLVSDDLAEVMRLRVRDADGREVPGALHVRGRALDRFDGSAWSATLPPPTARSSAWNRRAEVSLAPLSGNVVFGIGDLVRVDGVPASRGGNGTFLHRSPGLALSYVAYGQTAELDRVAADAGAWLQVPELDPRVITLAWSVGGEQSDPMRVAEELSRHLERTYAYVERPPQPRGDPLGWFLFEARAGHCEYFASALAVMLRVRGIPSRLATGFYTEEREEDGTAVVRRGHAHAWVEVATSNGWAVLDPTPASGLPAPDGSGWRGRLESALGSWYRDVVDYDTQAQFRAYGVLGKPLMSGESGEGSPVGAGLVGMVVAMVVLFVGMGLTRAVLVFWLGGRRDRAPRPDAYARLMAEARAIVRARGWDLPPALPPLEAADWVEAQVGPAADPLRRLAWIVYRQRYGGDASAAALAEGRACVRALRALPTPRAVAQRLSAASG